MVKALFDTNVLIDYLNGVVSARDELDRYAERAISIISWMEVMIGAQQAVRDRTETFLEGFNRIDIDMDVAAKAVAIRRKHGIKLPDAIVWASADVNGMLLVTRNTKDFPEDHPGVRIPYRL